LVQKEEDELIATAIDGVVQHEELKGAESRERVGSRRLKEA
jgi:hypothetical protein